MHLQLLLRDVSRAYVRLCVCVCLGACAVMFVRLGVCLGVCLGAFVCLPQAKIVAVSLSPRVFCVLYWPQSLLHSRCYHFHSELRVFFIANHFVLLFFRSSELVALLGNHVGHAGVFPSFR